MAPCYECRLAIPAASIARAFVAVESLGCCAATPWAYGDLCQKHIDGLWIPEHLTPQEAAAFALDHFKRAVVSGLEVLEVEVE